MFGKGDFPTSTHGMASMENSGHSSWMLKACQNLMSIWIQSCPPLLKLIKYASSLYESHVHLDSVILIFV